MHSNTKTSIAERFPANKVLWTLVVQAMAIVPHVRHLPSWILLVAIVVGIWRYHASRRQWRPPSLVLRVLLVGIGSFAVYLSYGTLLGRDAGVAMIIVMLALKLLELNRRRDVVLFVLLGYFLVVTNFLYSQTLVMALYMFLVAVLLTSALAAVSDPSWRIRPMEHVRLAGTLLLQAVPVALLLFVLFPRISGPLWQLPDDAHAGTTGLSEHMAPGSISQLVRSNDVAFRVDFLDPAPPQALMYWRGPVLDDYDGRNWSAASHAPGRDRPRLASRRVVRYQVTLEANGRPWLLALDVPISTPAGTVLSRTYEVIASAPIQERRRYEMRSLVRRGLGIGGVLPSAEQRQALQLLPYSDPRTRALGQALGAAYKEPHTIVDAALKRFRAQEYVYTLNPPLLGGNPIDEFLFDTRRGFCEHYAGAFVFLMRAAGIPARVVTGYQGGEYNPTGSYWIVRQSDAHAWAEVWLPQQGWVRIDPTASIAPQRIEAGIEAALPEQVQRTGFQRSKIGLLRDIGLVWDSIDNRWNQWVLGYGPQRQLAFLRELGLGPLQWIDLALMAALTVTVALLLLAAAMAIRHRPPTLHPTAKAWQLFCRKLARVGLERRPHEGPAAFAERVTAARPDLGAPVLQISALYAELCYARDGGGRRVRDLLQRVATFRPGQKNPK